MSTQQDIYAAGSKKCPPMLNKKNYVPWSSRLLRYAKNRPNGKLIYNSIINSPYFRRMIPKPGDAAHAVPVPETFHEQTNDELTEAEIKQMEADDQAIQTILHGLPKCIYAAVDSYETAQEIWFTSTDGESIESYYHRFSKLMNDFKRNKQFPEKIATYAKSQRHPTAAMNMALVLMAKALKLNYSTPTNNNQRISSNPQNRQIAQPGMNLGQDNQMQMNPGVQNVGNQNGVIVVPSIANQNGNGNIVAARAEGNANGNNGNQIRCYNCRGLGHLARNCTVKPRRRDAAYLQTQLLVAQKEEARIQLQAEEFDLMAVVADLDEIEETDQLMYNFMKISIMMRYLIFSHQVQQNDSNVIFAVSSVEQGGGTVEQHPVNVEETRVLYDSLYNNLAIEVEKVNSVNRKLRETNDDLTTQLARYKNQEKCKQITALNEEISNLNKQLSKEKSTVSSLQEEKKRLKSNFRIRKDELLDKQNQLENKIKELDNILVKTGQLIQTMHMLSPKPDSFYHTKQKMALGYQNPFYLKQAQQKQQSLYNGNVLL
ncbi:integrase, catalytic region, zinc finger, CCHC-type containing protein [Tanacetum coccineum]